jgi:hypothetical protein
LMARSFDTATVSANEIAPLLPLVQATWPEVDLATWRKFVEFHSAQHANRGSGILRFSDAAGCFYGVLAYRIERNLRPGLVLYIHLFTAVDLANSDDLVQTLVDAAEREAIKLDCADLQIRLTGAQVGLASRLRNLGLSESAGCMWKKVGPTKSLE